MEASAHGIRFHLDEHLSPQIAAIGLDYGLDITISQQAGRLGMSDEEQLLLAAEDGRCLVTRNYDDFDDPTRLFAIEARANAGVLFVPPSIALNDFAGIVAALAQYAVEHPESMPPYMVDYLRPVRR